MKVIRTRRGKPVEVEFTSTLEESVSLAFEAELDRGAGVVEAANAAFARYALPVKYAPVLYAWLVA